MEPSQDDRIRQKIREAELQPDNWNKEEVWSRVNPQPKKERSRAVYYAAASLTALMAMSIYAWMVYQKNSFELRMRSLELAIERERSSAQQETRIVEVPFDCKELLPSALAVDKQAKSDQKFELNVAASNPTPKTTVVTPVVEVTSLPSGEPTVVAATEVDEVQIESSTPPPSGEFTPTVITILPEPSQPKPAVARNRKVKLPLFRRMNREYNLKDNNNDEILFANIYH